MTHKDIPEIRLRAVPSTPPVPPSGRPVMLSVEEVVRALGVGRTKVYELLKDGSLGSVTIGRRRLVPVAELQRFADGLIATMRAAS